MQAPIRPHRYACPCGSVVLEVTGPSWESWPESKAKKARERDPRLPAAGTTLTRTFKGKVYRVTVLDAGFRYDGRGFRSLTAIAREVTGYPAISGPAWFGVAERAAATPKVASTKETVTPAAPAKKRAPRARRAGRDPQSAAPGQVPDAAAPTEAATN